jgi:GAF domain-containing protein
MQGLADQVAVAIQNARLFQEAQESLAAERRAYGELSREAWATLLRARPDLGFTRSRGGLSPVGKEWRPEMEKAIQAGQTTVEEDGGTGTVTVAIPVRVGGQIIGVMDARRRLEAGEWSPQEIELVETLSEQLGLALEGARLYQDTQRRAARDRLLGEVTARMRESLEMETLLRTAASEMRQALGLDDLVVRLTAPGGDGDPAQDLTGTQVEEGTDDANLD